jgi:hypothetical protein
MVIWLIHLVAKVVNGIGRLMTFLWPANKELENVVGWMNGGVVWYGTVWYGMVWYGMMAWYGMVWYGTVLAFAARLIDHSKIGELR